MRHVEALVLLTAAASSVLANEPSRPRGVGPEFAKFYKNPSTFTCISHPSIILPVTKVNDNYCDCPDGSDEPGTAACTHLSPWSPSQPVPGSVSGTSNATIALPGFYCKNKGHIPAYLPFSYVNDGVCDYDTCCDGSDEWEGAGGVKCEDRCAAIGKEYKKGEERRQKAALASVKRRGELVQQAILLKTGVEERIRDLEVEVQALEVKAAEAKKRLEDVERKERGRVVSGASPKASRVTMLAKLAKQRVEELRGALLTTVERRDAAREKVKELEGILATFKEEYNPNFNDEGVKRAVRAWDDYAAKKGSASGEGVDNSAEDRDIDAVANEDSESEGINWLEWEAEEEESDVEAIYRFEEYLPIPVREWIHGKTHAFRVMLIENGILADNSNSAVESKAVQDARNAYQSNDDDLSGKQNQIRDHQADLVKDYGPDDVFRAMSGTCIEQDSGEYTYELCWMDKTSQKSKKGGGNTGMGNFVGFDSILVDEEVGVDGKGLGGGERITLKYENGQHCWNGPNRQTTVIIACAEKDEIWKVVEAEKCVYRMEVGTPAACEVGKNTSEKQGEGQNKDEL